MRGAILYGPRDVRFEERDVPKIIKPTDAIIRISASCSMWIRFVAIPRHQPSRPADADGARVLWHRRRDRKLGQVR